MFLGEKILQDNAPEHNSILSKTWFSENALEILENWPRNSPDINFIGNVCSLLKKKFSKDIPKLLGNFGDFVKKNSK